MTSKITTYHGADTSSTLDLNNLFVQVGCCTVTVANQIDATTSKFSKMVAAASAARFQTAVPALV